MIMTYIIVNDKVGGTILRGTPEDLHATLMRAGAIFIEETGQYTFNKDNIAAKADHFLADNCSFLYANVTTVRCLDNTQSYNSLFSRIRIDDTDYIVRYEDYAKNSRYDHHYKIPDECPFLHAVETLKSGNYYYTENWDKQELETPLPHILAIAKYEAEKYLYAEQMGEMSKVEASRRRTWILNSSLSLKKIKNANPNWDITFMDFFHEKLHLILKYYHDGTDTAFCNLRCYEDDNRPPNWNLLVKKLSVVHFTTYNYVAPKKCPGLQEALAKLQTDCSSFPDYFKIKKTAQGEITMKNWYISKNALSEEDINDMSREEILDWLYYGGNETPRQKLGEWDPREDTLEEYLAEIVPVMFENFGGKITVKDAAKYLTSIWNTVATEIAENENLEIKEDITKNTEKTYDRELGAAIAFGRFMARENLEVDSLEDAREIFATMRQDACAATGETPPSKEELPDEVLEYAINFGEHMYLQELTTPKEITAVEIFKTMERDYQKNHSYHYFSNFAKERIEGYFQKAQNKTKARPASSKNVR